MLQAVEHCVQDGWVVIYIPRGVFHSDLVSLLVDQRLNVFRNQAGRLDDVLHLRPPQPNIPPACLFVPDPPADADC